MFELGSCDVELVYVTCQNMFAHPLAFGTICARSAVWQPEQLQRQVGGDRVYTGMLFGSSQANQCDNSAVKVGRWQTSKVVEEGKAGKGSCGSDG